MNNLSPTCEWFKMRIDAALINGDPKQAEIFLKEFLDWLSFQQRYDYFEITEWIKYEKKN